MKKFFFLLFSFMFFGVAAQSDWTDKLSPQLKTYIEADSLSFSVLVVMAEQAGLEAWDSNWTKSQKNEYVFTELLETATTTQSGVISFLESIEADFRPYYIVNMIYADSLDVSELEFIAGFDAVGKIIPNHNLEEITSFQDRTQEEYRNNTPTWGILNIKADSVWTLGYEGQEVVIGGQDTGYDWDVSPIKDKYRGNTGAGVDHNYNWHDAIRYIHPLHKQGDNPALNPCGLKVDEPCDDNGHGTHTMGTMVGQDSSNIIGVAPKASWIGCRNMERGWGSAASYIECYEWFLAPTDLNDENPDFTMSPDVINNSWGCPQVEGCQPEDYAIMSAAVAHLKMAGIFVVVSAGNDGPGCETINSPSPIFESSFSVGATASNDTIAGFSSRGPVTVDGSFRMKPNVSAPGVSVASVVPGGAIRRFSGTSMAGPHVAGAVALILSANPALKGHVDIVEDILESTARPRTTDQECTGLTGLEVPNPVYGFGIIDVYAAVQKALDFSLSSTEEPELGQEIKVYPNPSSGRVYIDSPVDLKDITVTTMQGAVIMKISPEGKQKVEVQLPEMTTQLVIIRSTLENGEVRYARVYVQ